MGPLFLPVYGSVLGLTFFVEAPFPQHLPSLEDNRC